MPERARPSSQLRASARSRSTPVDATVAGKQPDAEFTRSHGDAIPPGLAANVLKLRPTEAKYRKVVREIALDHYGYVTTRKLRSREFRRSSFPSSRRGVG